MAGLEMRAPSEPTEDKDCTALNYFPDFPACSIKGTFYPSDW